MRSILRKFTNKFITLEQVAGNFKDVYEGRLKEVKKDYVVIQSYDEDTLDERGLWFIPFNTIFCFGVTQDNKIQALRHAYEVDVPETHNDKKNEVISHESS